MAVVLTYLLPIAVIIGIWIFFFIIMRKQQQAKPEVKTAAGCCQTCGTKAPVTRKPYDFQEFMWGGWTCETCLTTVDRLGVARPGVTERSASRPLPSFWLAAIRYRFALMGGFWGFFMWIVMIFIPAVATGLRTGNFDTRHILFGLALYAVGGAVFGGLMYFVTRAVQSKKPKGPADHF